MRTSPHMKSYSRPRLLLQVAQLGGPNIGFEWDPEGAWVDQDVFLDRDEAEARANLHETSRYVDKDGRDISQEVTTVARVITFAERVQEFGEDRGLHVTTTFNKRIAALFAALPEDR